MDNKPLSLSLSLSLSLFLSLSLSPYLLDAVVSALTAEGKSAKTSARPSAVALSQVLEADESGAADTQNATVGNNAQTETPAV